MTDTSTDLSPDELADLTDEEVSGVVDADPALAERDPELAAEFAQARLQEARRLAKRYADDTRKALAGVCGGAVLARARDRNHPGRHEALKEFARARCRYRAAGGNPSGNHFEELLEPADLAAACERPAIFTCIKNQDYEGAIAAWNADPLHVGVD